MNFKKPYSLVAVLVTLQEQPSPLPRLVKIWRGEFMRENLLSISKFLRRQTAGRQLKPFFIPVKFYIVKLPCSCTTATKWKYSCCQVSFIFFSTELFICIFAPGECPISKGFIDACVFDSVMQALTVDLQEKSIKIKIKNNHQSFFHCRHKMKYSCYQDSIFGY